MNKLIESHVPNLFPTPKVYYKVTSNDLTSAITIISGSFSVDYKLLEWVEPKIGKLFVFDELNRAIKWFARLPGYRVFECEIVEAPFRLNLCSAGDNIEKFWYLHSQCITRDCWDYFLNNFALDNCPIGTVMANKVKLLNEITNDVYKRTTR